MLPLSRPRILDVTAPASSGFALVTCYNILLIVDDYGCFVDFSGCFDRLIDHKAILGPEKPTGLVSWSSSDEESVEEKHKKSRKVKKASSGKHSRKHKSKEKSKDRNKKKREERRHRKHK